MSSLNFTQRRSCFVYSQSIRSDRSQIRYNSAMRGSLLHIHRRQRSKKLEPYPSPRFWMRVLDRLAISAGIIGPAMTIPQIWQIYYFQNATGVSAISWGTYTLLNTVFIAYGIAHKNTLIFVTYSLWIIVNATVTIGAILYG